MKKIIYLSTVALFSVGAVMAQTGMAPKNVKMARTIDVSEPQPEVKTKPTTSYAKSGNAVWTDDFSNPDTWVFTNTSTPNPLDWSIETDNTISPVGALNPINLTSWENGFAFINGDPEGEGSVQNADMTTANPIDLTNFENVSLVFEQVSRNFATTYTVRVSIDGGDTWVPYPVNEDLAVNTNTANPDEVTVNISDLAGGQPNVLIQFNFTAEWGWFWAIDDVAIIETPDNDMRLLGGYYNGWVPAVDAIVGEDPTPAEDLELVRRYEYSSFRTGQVRPLTLTGEVINQGAQIQTNVILQASVTGPDGVTTEYESAGVDVEVGSIVLLTIDDVMPPQFSGEGQVGSYTVSFNIIQDEEDAIPGNNTVADKTFTVNEEYMANDLGDNWATYYPTLGQNVTWATRFVMEEEQSFNYIQFAVVNATQGPTQPGEIIYLNVRTGSVFAAEGGGNSLQLLFGEEDIEYVIEEDEISQGGDVIWITKFFPDNEPITLPTDLIVQGEVNIPAGETGIVWVPMANQQETLSSSLYDFDDVSSGPQGWWSLGGNVPLIRLGMSGSVGVDGPSDLDFKMGQNYPNPTTGNTRIDWELLVPAQNVQFSITDISGRTVYERDLGDRPSGVQEPIELNLNLAAGNYQYGLTIGNQRIVRKLVVVR